MKKKKLKIFFYIIISLRSNLHLEDTYLWKQYIYFVIFVFVTSNGMLYS